MPEGDDSENRLASRHLSYPDGRRYAVTAHPTEKIIDDNQNKSRASLHPPPKGIGIYTTFLYYKYNELQVVLLHFLLERAGVKRIKSSGYISLIPTFFLNEEEVHTCVDTYDLKEGALRTFLVK